MATISKQAIEIKTPAKGEWKTFKEGSAQSFKRGELATLSSGRIIALSGTDPAANTIAGVFGHDASGVQDTDVLVFVPEPDCEFVLNVGVAQVTALANIGTLYESVEESDKVHVDTSATTTTVWVVTALDGRDRVGDTNGRVVAKIVTARLQLTE